MERRAAGDVRPDPTGGGTPRLVITADDFGHSPEINAAVLRAHRDGILTTASLMVTGDAFDEAVELARQTPSLAVGLHVVVAKGRSVLPHREIPHLVDREGNFPDSPTRAGLRYFFSRSAQRELSLELEAQLERFAATGLPLSHVDGHLHMHLHPSVLQRLLPLAERYGARGFRVTRDRLWPALRGGGRRAASRATLGAVFGLLSSAGIRRVRRYRFAVPSRCYGLIQSGNMHESYVISLLHSLGEEFAEIHFHPTTGARIDEFGPNRGDLESLVSPAVRRVIEERRLTLTTYPAACSP